jgi:hypothetical protein
MPSAAAASVEKHDAVSPLAVFRKRALPPAREDDGRAGVELSRDRQDPGLEPFARCPDPDGLEAGLRRMMVPDPGLQTLDFHRRDVCLDGVEGSARWVRAQRLRDLDVLRVRRFSGRAARPRQDGSESGNGERSAAEGPHAPPALEDRLERLAEARDAPQLPEIDAPRSGIGLRPRRRPAQRIDVAAPFADALGERSRGAPVDLRALMEEEGQRRDVGQGLGIE